MQEDTVRCRFCGEQILAVAIKCKHCHSDLSEPGSAAPRTEPLPASDYGIPLLAIPIVAVLLMWLWVGNMNLLQSPGAWLWFCAIATVAATAVLATVEDSKARGSTDAKWVVTLALVWVIGYPAYLGHRTVHGLKDLRVAGIVVALAFVGSLFYFDYALGKAQDEALRAVREIEESIPSVDAPNLGSVEAAGEEAAPNGELAATDDLASAEAAAAEPVTDPIRPEIPPLQEGMFAAGADQLLTLAKTPGGGFEATLTLGAGGSTACVEGDVSCLSIAGVVQPADGGYRVKSDDDCAFLVESTANGLVLSDVHGNCGTGTGNRDRLASVAGTYAALCESAKGEWSPCEATPPAAAP